MNASHHTGVRRRLSPLYGRHPAHGTARGPQVTVRTDAEGSRVTRHLVDGRLHREDGPALITVFADGTRREEFHVHGRLVHGELGIRERGPDGQLVEYFYSDQRRGCWREIETAPNGASYEKHLKDFKLHREDGPASIDRQPDGSFNEEYLLDGNVGPRADGGPNYVIGNADGTRIELWTDTDGLAHREDGPAQVEILANGDRIERYLRHGNAWREHGPARVVRSRAGKVVHQSEFFADGQRVPVKA